MTTFNQEAWNFATKVVEIVHMVSKGRNAYIDKCIHKYAYDKHAHMQPEAEIVAEAIIDFCTDR